MYHTHWPGVFAHEETTMNLHKESAPYGYCNIRPTNGPNEEKTSLWTFRFLSASGSSESLGTAAEHEHLITALKLSLPYGTILRSKEKTVVYPLLQFCSGNYDNVNTNACKPENYTIQGYATKSCLYKDIRQFKPETEDCQNDQPHYAHSILLGFKTFNTKALLDSWKDWTGARYIYINFPIQLRLCKITLYYKNDLDKVNLFNYIVKVDCDGVDTREKQVLLLDFVQRLRAERTSHFCSLYEEV